MRDREDATASQASTTPLLAPLDVVELLGVSLTTVKRLTAAGELPYVRVSDRRPRYTMEDVARFIAERRSPDRPSKDDDPEGTGSLVRSSAAGVGRDAKRSERRG